MSATCEMYLNSVSDESCLGAIKSSTRQELFRRLFIARKFIDTNLTRSITLEDVASEACLSKYHFMRLFKKAFGQTVHQYITQNRLEKTRQLLEKENKPFAEICRSMGYEDIAWFGKVYKKAFGVSPMRKAKMPALEISHQQQTRAVA